MTPDIVGNHEKTNDPTTEFNSGKNKQNPAVQNLIEKQKKHLREELDKSQKYIQEVIAAK